MAAQIFPFGTALTVVWHLTKPDGTSFDLSGYTYRAYYRTGNKETLVNSTNLLASGNTLSISIPANEPVAPGEYALRLVLYQNQNLFCTLNYNAAFVLSRQLAKDSSNQTQEQAGNVVHLYTVAEFYLLAPVIPTIGLDKNWYVNGVIVTDSHGDYVSAEHTLRYDETTKCLIIDEGRVDSHGQSIQQTITDVADALADWESRYAANEGSEVWSVAGDGSRWGSFKASEAVRDQQEESRVEAEEGRVEAEDIRQENEGVRLATEARMENVLDSIVVNFLADSDLYEQAVEQGFEGTRDEWLQSTMGVKGVGIATWLIDQSDVDSGTTTHTITLNDSDKPGGPTVYTFTVKNGKGITSVAPVGTPSAADSAVNTYRVGYSDSTTPFDFNVKNGKGIVSVVQESAGVGSEADNIIRVNYSEGNSTTFIVKNGQQGNTGSSVAYPYELINNLTTTATDKGLTAAMGKQLQDTKIEAVNVLATVEDVPDNYYTKSETATYVTGRIADNLTTNDATKILSAKQGKALQDTKVNTSDIVNDLTTGGATVPLSAQQGVVLEGEISQLGQEVDGRLTKDIVWSNGYVQAGTGLIKSSTLSRFSQPILLKAGEKVTIGTQNSNIGIICSTDADSVAVGDTVTAIKSTTASGQFETYEYTATEDIKIVLCVLASNYTLSFYDSDNLTEKVANAATEEEHQMLNLEVDGIFNSAGNLYGFQVPATAGTTIDANTQYPVILNPGKVKIKIEDAGGVLSDGYIYIYKFVNGVRTSWATIQAGNESEITITDKIEAVSFYKNGGEVAASGIIKAEFKQDGLLVRRIESLETIAGRKVEKIDFIGNNASQKTDWGIGDKYYDTDINKIKICTVASPTPGFIVSHEPDKESVYIYDGSLYIYNDVSLIPVKASDDDTVINIGEVAYSGSGVQTKWFDEPIKFEDYSFITLHTNRADSLTNEIYVYAVYSSNPEDRIMLLPNIQPGGETVIQVPSNGWGQLYGILFYDPNLTQFSLTASVVLTNKSKCATFFESPEKWANYLPPYYLENDYLKKKTEIINKYLRENILSGDAFYFVTDTHWEYNRKHSPAIIRKLNKSLNIPKLFHGGDLYHNSPVMDALGVDCINAYRSALGNDRVYSCQGNHEYISDETYADSFVGMSMYLEDVVFGGADRQYFYLDNKVAKIRYIFLYVFGERVGGDYVAGYLDTIQMDWLRDVALAVDSGWDVFIFTHYAGSPRIATNEYVYPSGFSNLENIINGYNGSGRIVAVITGHTHRDFVLLESLNVPIIITTCDHNMNFSYGGVEEFANLQTPRTSDTVNEQAFDVVIYDRSRLLVHFIRIGSEADNKMNRLTTNVQVACRSIYCSVKSVGDSIELPTYLTSGVTWESSDTSVATVSSGTVSCVGVGCVRFTATDSNGEKQSFYLRVE